PPRPPDTPRQDLAGPLGRPPDRSTPRTRGAPRCCSGRPSCIMASSHGAAATGGGLLTEVRVGKDETLDSALRRFKRQVKRSGILTDAKRHEHYEKPSQKRRRRAARRKRF